MAGINSTTISYMCLTSMDGETSIWQKNILLTSGTFFQLSKCAPTYMKNTVFPIYIPLHHNSTGPQHRECLNYITQPIILLFSALQQHLTTSEKPKGELLHKRVISLQFLNSIAPAIKLFVNAKLCLQCCFCWDEFHLPSFQIID